MEIKGGCIVKYTRYNEENCVIDYSYYDELLDKFDERKYKSLKAYVRKVQFVENRFKLVTYDQIDEAPVFNLCMFFYENKDEQLYLEKKSRQNDSIYKSYQKITREQCERLLDNDIEWMKKSNVSMFREFYLYLTINGLEAATVMEYDREIFSSGKEYVVFNKAVKRAIDKDAGFFDEDVQMLDCINCDQIVMSCKKLISIPEAVNNILNTRNNKAYQLAFAL